MKNVNVLKVLKVVKDLKVVKADPLTLAPQTQSQQAATPRRSPRRVCDMFRNMIPLEGDVGNRTF